MKKFLLLLAIIVPFVLTSCGDDKDEPQNLEQELIGDWYFILNDYTAEHFLFNSNHTGKHWIKQDGEDINSSVDSFHWSLEEADNVTYIKLEHDDLHTDYASISIKDDELHITYTLTGMTKIFKKVQ